MFVFSLEQFAGLVQFLSRYPSLEKMHKPPLNRFLSRLEEKKTSIDSQLEKSSPYFVFG